MKANRAFRSEAQAVSPLLGTIMSVGIVVALAGSVWLLLHMLTKKTDATPILGLSRQGMSLSVTTVPDTTLDWGRDIRASGTCAPTLQLQPNGGTAGAYPTAAGTPVKVGDRLSGCTTGQTLLLVHIPTNRAMYQTTF